MRVATISLKRTPERWDAFVQRNGQSLRNCNVQRVDGIDGRELLSSGIKTRLIAHSALREWSAGAIGIGLSHLLCWRLCSRSKLPLVVLEDDVVLADDWHEQLQQLLHPSAGIVLLGWNMDSVLRAEFSYKQEAISLFEPAYPSEKLLLEILNSDTTRLRKRLRHSFGLPGYWLHPGMADRLLEAITQLEALPLQLGRGFPKVMTHGIDGLLNLNYYQIGAEIIIPPLGLAINDQITSLTKSGPKNFAKKTT